MTAASVASWGIEAVIASALLIAAVMLVRVPVRRAFGPGVAYALWALPLLRLLLPPLPAAWRLAAADPVRRAGETITILVIDPAGSAAAAPAASLPSLGVALLALWLAGAAAFMLWHVVSYHRFRRRTLRGARRVGEHDGVRVIASAAVPGPLAFGVVSRYVAFPADFAERYDADERALALAHELGHHQRGDLAANWAALAMLALHWFNPLAWRAFHAFRIDQELANDARVLTGRDPGERHAYACAIVKAAHGGAVSAACHLHTIRDMKGRLKMLTTSRASRRRLVTGTASIALLTVAGLGLTASGTSAAAAINDTVIASTGVDLQLPAPAAPPALATAIAPPAAPVPAIPVKGVRKRVVVVRDGKTTTYEDGEADAYIAAHAIPVPPVPPAPGAAPMVQMFVRSNEDGAAGDRIWWTRSIAMRDDNGKLVTFTMPEVPEITSRDCSDKGDRHEMVMRDKKGGKEHMTICTNRIRMMQADAEQLAANSEVVAAQARGNARASLGVARTAIETDRNLSADQKQKALAGIAQAEAELDAKAD